MFEVGDWLDFHKIDAEFVQDCLTSLTDGRFISEMGDSQVNQGGSDRFEIPGRRRDCIVRYVRPAIFLLLGRDDLVDMIDNVGWSELDSVSLPPHTIDHGAGHSPEIYMAWRGTAEDLVCLAHEVAHAVQIQLSGGALMPPVARETCAFLGELSLIAYARRMEPELAALLVQVWRDENKRYLGADCDALTQSLGDLNSAYDYRMNYPLARMAAVALFNKSDKTVLQSLFSAGSDAMRYLPLDEIADRAANIANLLPALPPPDAERPAIGAYRSLGAMVLLDIDGWKGDSEQAIGEYYAAMLAHMQQGTAFIGLRPDGRPLGYATWDVDDDGKIVLRRQCAPFGDHLILQQTLQQHLASGDPVIAWHDRSSRAEQVAW